MAIAHERFRLEQFRKILRDLMRRNDYRTAMKALEQAAKERGKAFTNVRNVQSQKNRVKPPHLRVSWEAA